MGMAGSRGRGGGGGRWPRGRRGGGRGPGVAVGSLERRVVKPSKSIQTRSNLFQIISNLILSKRAFPSSKNLNKIWLWGIFREEQLSPSELIQIQNVFWIKNLGSQGVFFTLGNYLK
jgi:hypothetical protein